jgi:hypothetical protein
MDEEVGTVMHLNCPTYKANKVSGIINDIKEGPGLIDRKNYIININTHG